MTTLFSKEPFAVAFGKKVQSIKGVTLGTCSSEITFTLPFQTSGAASYGTIGMKFALPSHFSAIDPPRGFILQNENARLLRRGGCKNVDWLVLLQQRTQNYMKHVSDAVANGCIQTSSFYANFGNAVAPPR